MRAIAIVNQKGGSGKTTTAVNLSAALGERDRQVLLIDLDPQASASHWYGIKDSGPGLLDVFTANGNLVDLVYQTHTAGVDVVPASPWLVGADKMLSGEPGAEAILRSAIQQLPGSRWDYLIFDCPPALGILTVNALAAAGEVLVPVEAHVMALSGLAQLLQTVDLIRERLNGELEITGILACRVDFRTRHAQDVVEQLRVRFGNLVYNVVIRENVRIAECPSFGQPIMEYGPRSAGAADYRALAEEVLGQERS